MGLRSGRLKWEGMFGLRSRTNGCTLSLFFSNLSTEHASGFRAGFRGVRLVEVFLKPKSKYYWCDFAVRGERFRGSTKESNETRAQKIAVGREAVTLP